MYIIQHALLLIGATRCLAQILMRFPPDLTPRNLHELHWALERAQVIRFYFIRFYFVRFHFVRFHFTRFYFIRFYFIRFYFVNSLLGFFKYYNHL
jgi:hypothetical protein